MARKKHLLEVLRERENRVEEGDTPSSQPFVQHRQPLVIPPNLLKMVGGIVVGLLLTWAGFTYLGTDDGSDDGTHPAETVVDPGAEMAVLAVTIDGSRLGFAKETGQKLVALGYDAKLAPSQSPSGEGQYQIFVRAADASELESLLQEIRGLSLEGLPVPFAGASLQTLPSR